MALWSRNLEQIYALGKRDRTDSDLLPIRVRPRLRFHNAILGHLGFSGIRLCLRRRQNRGDQEWRCRYTPSASVTAPIRIFSQSASVLGSVSTTPFLVTSVLTASKT